MASPSESRDMASEDTEVTSEHRFPGPQEGGGATRELDVEIPLVRQSSIYSLTLDEIQNTVCGPGKTFGSMNMDEFLTNIWNAEEGQANGTSAAPTAAALAAPTQAGGNFFNIGDPGGSLRRQGSLALPPPLCRKTVDEVWTDIYQGAAPGSHQMDGRCQDNHENAIRQLTFGEMTLEDFLIKAGVIREGYDRDPPPPPGPATPPHSGMTFQVPSTEASTRFSHMLGVGGYGNHHQLMGPANGVGYGVGSPASPGGSSEAMGGAHGECSAAAAMLVYGAAEGGGADASGMGSRKRPMEGGADKVVERRQRRMIKNRESAARSRARKQAYTLELEAELNQLKEENARLKEEQRRTMQLRKKLLIDAMAEQARINVGKTVGWLRRCNSSPW